MAPGAEGPLAGGRGGRGGGGKRSASRAEPGPETLLGGHQPSPLAFQLRVSSQQWLYWVLRVRVLLSLSFPALILGGGGGNPKTNKQQNPTLI